MTVNSCNILRTLSAMTDPTHDDVEIFCEGAGCHWADRTGCLAYNLALETIKANDEKATLELER